MDASLPLRRAYADICRGYSLGSYHNSPVYIKHFTVFDYTEIDTAKEKVFDEVVKRGVKTEEARLKWLSDNGLWVKKDDEELVMQKDYLETMLKTRSKMLAKTQVALADKQIAETRGKIADLSYKRARLIGKTAEQVADQKVQYEHMRLAFYQDPSLSTPLLNADSIAQLNDQDADFLLGSYVEVLNLFPPDILRKIAISPFFTNSFYLCGDDPTLFFGKPIVNLTVYQANLLSHGQYFKSLVTQNDIPKEFADDPDKIEDCVARSRNMKSIVEKAGPGDRMAIIGATSEDLKAAGLEDGSAKVRADINREIKSGMDAAKTREVTFT